MALNLRADRQAPDERARFRLIIDTIGQLEAGWPRPGVIARDSDVREAGIQLQLEVLGVRKEITEVDLRLREQIDPGHKEA